MAKKMNSDMSSVLLKYSAERNEEFIPTGYNVIDDLLGGGISPGALYAIWGVQGSGKCLKADSRVLTPNGYIPLRELLVSDEEWQDSKIPLYTPYGVETTDKVYYGKNKETIVLKCTKRHEVTPNHPILALHNGCIGMFRADQLLVGDSILLFRKAVEFPLTIGEQEAYNLGYDTASWYSDNSTEHFMGPDVPEEVYRLKMSERQEFLIGFIDGCSFSDEVGGWGVELQDYHIIEQLYDVWQTLGIIPEIEKKKIRNEIWYRCHVSVAELSRSPLKWFYHDKDFDLPTTTCYDWNMWSDFFKLDKIKKIYYSSAEVVDVSLPEHHLFYADGMLNHNTTVALQIAKTFCKRGDKVLWLDVEKALNQNQQESFGVRKFVQDGSFLHLTASTYEEADEITTAIANDSELGVKLVVIDSETMLLPKLTDDQKVTDSQPGQKSRQCNLWLTKIKSQFFLKKIACIVLSHARANISMTGSPYGPQEKIAGGFSLKHIPDCIIQVTPGQKFGDKESPEGQVVHVTTDKNKFAKPFQKKDFKLFFGVGIKKSVDLIDRALASGVIEQSGSFFKLPDGETVRGIEALYSLSSDKLRALQDLMK